MRRWATGRLLLAVVCLVAVVGAQKRIAHANANGYEIVTARISPAGGTAERFGLSFVLVELENVDTVPHEVALHIGMSDGRPGNVQSSRRLVLEPGRTRLFLPLPVPPIWSRFECTIDGVEYTMDFTFKYANGAMGLVIADDPARAPDAERLLTLLPSPPHPGTPGEITCNAADVPADWRLLTSFTGVIVDGRAAVDAEQQEALRRLTHAGGTVVVTEPSALPAGPLRELATSPHLGEQQRLEYGFGTLLVVPTLGVNTASQAAVLRRMGDGDDSLWPAADELFVEQDIAGLGDAPVTAFLLVILAFAILVGPVNFLILRRRRQPLLALLTVPVLGFGTTFVILAYGVLHDGFGVRGTMVTWTMLDQQRHEAASVCMRTLFAGLAPDELTMPADVLVLSQRACYGAGAMTDTWNWDGDRQRLDGGLLPSRTVTPLVSVQQGPVRDRLTVRADGDELELLSGGIEFVGDVMLCDFAGGLWSGSGSRLRRVASRGEWTSDYEQFVAHASELRPRGGVRAQIRRMLPARLEPGMFVGEVRGPAWIDEHGLEVEYDTRRHYLCGRMAPEDFLE